MKKKLFNFLTFSLFNFFPLLAATSPLASTNDYYYTTPKTTNICGRVMGENGDYKLVRAEDLAFINEAWAERTALMGWAGHTNATAEGTLVKGGADSYEARQYWNRVRLEPCVITNLDEHPLTAATDGAMTNITTVITNARPRKLVTMGWLTNNFATLKKMNCMVVVPHVSSSNKYETVETQYSYYKVNWWDTPNENTTTNRSQTSFTVWSLYEAGAGSVSRSQMSEETWSETRSTYNRRTEGSGTLQLSFEVADTNAWLRGQRSPKVVRSARAWCRIQGSSFTSDNDESTATNAWVLVDLGEARFGSVATDRLVYELDVDIRSVWENKVRTKAPWLLSLAEVDDAAAVPEMSEWGVHDKSKEVTMAPGSIYLVLDLKPVTSLEGW